FTIADLVQDMVSIPAGTFVMGSPDDELDRRDKEGPQTTVTISIPFWMSKYEVTQGQYEEVMGNNPSHFKNAGLNAPVEQVSWNSAVEFCRKLTEREQTAGRLPDGYEYGLPTEAQWEYACRAGTTTRFSFGDDPGYNEVGKYAWYSSNSGSTTHPVGEKLENPWGLHDMHGNVWEWCLDWKGDYPGGNQIDPVGSTTGTDRVFRGGSWLFIARLSRSANRSGSLPSNSYYLLGFRPALVLVP
ncbi:MAG TPA: formylglycine-generating enzyme family protein, partial [Verrucomicrobiales bacterium]|nr:formylglycine-generating enzyme family protein [Verrucomicrobiales bacterium]